MLSQDAEMYKDITVDTVADDESETPRRIEPFHPSDDGRHVGFNGRDGVRNHGRMKLGLGLWKMTLTRHPPPLSRLTVSGNRLN